MLSYGKKTPNQPEISYSETTQSWFREQITPVQLQGLASMEFQSDKTEKGSSNVARLKAASAETTRNHFISVSTYRNQLILTTTKTYLHSEGRSTQEREELPIWQQEEEGEDAATGTQQSFPSCFTTHCLWNLPWRSEKPRLCVSGSAGNRERGSQRWSRGGGGESTWNRVMESVKVGFKVAAGKRKERWGREGENVSCWFLYHWRLPFKRRENKSTCNPLVFINCWVSHGDITTTTLSPLNSSCFVC